MKTKKYAISIEPKSSAEVELTNLHQQLKALPASFENRLTQAGDNQRAKDQLIDQMETETKVIQDKMLKVLFKTLNRM